MIEILDVSKAYPNGVHALNHVKLKIDDGEFVYVIGATGSGRHNQCFYDNKALFYALKLLHRYH